MHGGEAVIREVDPVIKLNGDEEPVFGYAKIRSIKIFHGEKQKNREVDGDADKKTINNFSKQRIISDSKINDYKNNIMYGIAVN